MFLPHITVHHWIEEVWKWWYMKQKSFGHGRCVTSFHLSGRWYPCSIFPICLSLPPLASILLVRFWQGNFDWLRDSKGFAPVVKKHHDCYHYSLHCGKYGKFLHAFQRKVLKRQSERLIAGVGYFSAVVKLLVLVWVPAWCETLPSKNYNLWILYKNHECYLLGLHFKVQHVL